MHKVAAATQTLHSYIIRSAPAKRNNSCWIEPSPRTQRRVQMKKGNIILNQRNLTFVVTPRENGYNHAYTCYSQRLTVWLITLLIGRLTVLHLWSDQQASSTPAHSLKHRLHVTERGRMCALKSLSSLVSAHMKWCTGARQDVCERASSSMFMGVRTHTRERSWGGAI